MWVYRGGNDCFEVGYYAPDGAWFTESVCVTKDEAAARVNYLNGGSRKVAPALTAN